MNKHIVLTRYAISSQVQAGYMRSPTNLWYFILSKPYNLDPLGYRLVHIQSFLFMSINHSCTSVVILRSLKRNDGPWRFPTQNSSTLARRKCEDYMVGCTRQFSWLDPYLARLEFMLRKLHGVEKQV